MNGKIWEIPFYTIIFVVEITNQQKDKRKSVGQFAQPYHISNRKFTTFFLLLKRDDEQNNKHLPQ